MSKEIMSKKSVIIESADKLVLHSIKPLSQTEMKRVLKHLGEFLGNSKKTCLIVDSTFKVYVMRKEATVELLDLKDKKI